MDTWQDAVEVVAFAIMLAIIFRGWPKLVVVNVNNNVVRAEDEAEG